MYNQRIKLTALWFDLCENDSHNEKSFSGLAQCLAFSPLKRTFGFRYSDILVSDMASLHKKSKIKIISIL